MKTAIILLTFLVCSTISFSQTTEKTKAATINSSTFNYSPIESYGIEYEVFNIDLSSGDSTVLNQIDLNLFISEYRKAFEDVEIGDLTSGYKILIYSEEKSNALRDKKK